MSKLFSFEYLTTHCSMVKCQKMSIVKRLILSLQQKKTMDFYHFEEYLKSISNKILLRQCKEKQVFI